MIAHLEKALNVRRNELLPATLLFLYLFLVLGAYIMGQSVGKALFVKAFTAAYLPHAIIGTALLIGAFVSVYIRLSHRMRLEPLIIGCLLFLALCFGVFWWLTRFQSRWVLPFIYIWVYTAGALGPTMGWTLANYVLTTREARRVFGFIGAGAILGGVFAGFLTADITRHHHMSPEALLLIVAVFLAACAVLVKLLFLSTRERLLGIGTRPAAGHGAPRNFLESLALIRDSRYLRLITGLIAISCAATTILDYQFTVIAANTITKKEALTAFFGAFSGWVGLASFLLQLLVTGRLLRSVGIRVTLFVLPLVLFGGTTAVLLAPVLLAASVLKGSHYLLRYSLDKSTTELLYLPVPPDIKSQVKSFIDTFIWRFADGIAGVTLFFFASKLKFSPSRISLVNFAFLGGWIAVAYGVRREYLNVLRRAIERRTLDPERTAAGVLDATTKEALAWAVETGDEQQVLYQLSLFQVSAEQAFHPMLRRLLEHSSPAVRARALRLLGDAGDREITPQVEKLLGDPAPEVRTEAMHYLVVHCHRDPLRLLSTETDLPDYSLQGSVVAYLAQLSEPGGLAAAQLILEAMISRTGEQAVHSRMEAARVLGVIPPPFPMHSELGPLLRDPAIEVVEQALLSTGKVQVRDFLPLVIDRLANPRLVLAARTALVQYGGRAIGTLHDYLNDDAVPLAVRKEIPETLARIGTQEAVNTLTNSLIQTEPGLRFKVVKALNKLRRQTSLVVACDDYDNMLRAEIIGYYRSFRILAAFDPEASVGQRDPCREPLLTRALRERMEYELERIFRLLALIYPPRDIHNAFVGLTSGRPQLHANALEVLEHLLQGEMYRQLVYILDPEITLKEKLAFAERLCRVGVESKTEALRILLNSGDCWLAACAMHEIGESRLAALADDLRQVPRDADPVMQETWKWTTARLAATAQA